MLWSQSRTCLGYPLLYVATYGMSCVISMSKRKWKWISNWCYRFLYQGREVSYSSVLSRSISARQRALYSARGFDIERWQELTEERKRLRREVDRIRGEYSSDRDVVKEEGKEEPQP